MIRHEIEKMLATLDEPRKEPMPALWGVGLLASVVFTVWASLFAVKALYPAYVAAFTTESPEAVASLSTGTPYTPSDLQTEEEAFGHFTGAEGGPAEMPAEHVESESFRALQTQSQSDTDEATTETDAAPRTIAAVDTPRPIVAPRPQTAAEPQPQSPADDEPRPVARAEREMGGSIIAASMNSATSLAVESSLFPRALPKDLRAEAQSRLSQADTEPQVTQVALSRHEMRDRPALGNGETCGPSLVRNMPDRRGGATGQAFLATVGNGSGSVRDNFIVSELARGNMPGFLHDLQPVVLNGTDSRGSDTRIVICVTPDYLAVGSDRDFVRVPLGLPAAASIASRFDMMLPTSRIVDAIYAQAQVKLSPKPMQAGPQMSSTDYFLRHNATIEGQRNGRHGLIAGHKKDVVVANRMASNPGRVAIYGWHRSKGDPIQPVSTVHGASYADYSHGIRLVSRTAFVNGRAVDLEDLLSSDRYAYILNADGPLPPPVFRIASR